MFLRSLLVGVLLAGLWAFPAPVAWAFGGAERILDFKSLIVVHPDATMTVTETITVNATGHEIRRGIVREFPTTYKDRFGNTVKVGFDLKEVLKNGRPEPYHTESVRNGEKIYIGQKNVYLPPGMYTYTIRYDTDRQIGYFQDFDELYWNVTGNGWTFPIDHAEAVVVLPEGGRILKYAAYTGPAGAQGKDYQVSHDRAGNIVFTTTRGLAPHEGLTIAVSWPKGLVAAPSGKEKLGWYLRDNLSNFVAVFGLLITFAYFLMVWVRVGRDPARGNIIPLYTPPQGFSPAAVRYLMRMGYDQKTFAAALVDMAVKGYLKIEEENDEYTLRRISTDRSHLDNGESLLGALLFQNNDVLVLKNTNHPIINEARTALKGSLEKELNNIYFHTNRSSFFGGVALTVLTLAAVVLTAADATAFFALIWLSGWSVACVFLAAMVYRSWQGARSGHHLHFGKIFTALASTLFALPFFAGEVFGLGFFGMSISGPAALAFALLVFINALFYYLLKAPTLAGRQVMDQVEGFKMYLSVAEKDRLNMLNPPEKTPQLFEKYLPYALALNVENEWSEQFAEVLAKAQVDGQAYSPSWYRGSSWNRLGASGLSDSLGGAFAGAIASSAVAPGSSSGSGGGGFSGGGGGGGGGSGW
jgi:uncharacterized membrane protein YgcG|uniref:DUF2207 domain-containing protein n=1 Tax=Desulfobacca acetoxidans TaxID=60893 RepID=A0A7V6A1X8_9BACT